MNPNKFSEQLCGEFEEEFDDVAELQETDLPSPSLLEFYRRLKKREIMWNDDIDDATIDIAMYIRKWNQEDVKIVPEMRKPIKIFINTDGGSALAVLHIIDTILLSKTPVITIGMGRAYSAGGLLLMAGHKRYIFKHTSCLIHDGVAGAADNIGKLQDNLKFIEELGRRTKDYILSRTKITSEMYDENYRRDWFLFSDDIIKYGIADEIVTDIDTVL